MLSGLYFINFHSTFRNINVGQGIIMIEDGFVNGADFNYIYQGTFDFYGDDIKAEIDVRHYRGPLNSVLGPFKEFTLILSGKKSGDNFEVIGAIPNNPNQAITIIGSKIADLYPHK